MRTAMIVAACGLLALTAPAQEKKKGYAEASVSKIQQEAQDLLAAQDFEAAAAAFKKVTELQPDNARAWHLTGYSLHAAGKLDEALKFHLKATEFEEVAGVATYNVSCVYAIKGEKDKAFEWLVKAMERGFNNANQLVIDPDMDSLRDDPRFAKIKKSMEEAAAADGGALAVFAPTTPRQGHRYMFWSGSSSPGQIVIDYGAPVWKDSYSAQIGSERMTGRRWRLGSNFWTVLDTNVELKVAGKTVPAGSYYLTAEHTQSGKYVLAFNDPQVIRKQRLDAFLAHRTEGGIEVELKHEEVDDVAEALSIKFVPNAEHKTEAELVIHFGPHAFTAPVSVNLERKSADAGYDKGEKDKKGYDK